MNRTEVLIFDCNGDLRPAICFNLELAGIGSRVVTEEDETLNLMRNARVIGESIDAVLVNNPFLNVGIDKLVDDLRSVSAAVPIVFVKDSQNFRKLFEAVCHERNEANIYCVEPTVVVELLRELFAFDDASSVVDACCINGGVGLCEKRC